MRHARNLRTWSKLLLLSLFALWLTASTGCSSQEVRPPQLDVFSSMDLVSELPDTGPLDLPPSPRVVVETRDDGAEVLVYDDQEGQRLLAYLETLRSNTQIAREQQRVIRAQQRERRALVETGRLVEQEANYLRRRAAGLERDLEKERFWHDTDNLIHRIILVPLLFLAL